MTWTDLQPDNLATYNLSGLPSGRRRRVQDNGALFLATNSGPYGAISFTVKLNTPHTLHIPPPQGWVVLLRSHGQGHAKLDSGLRDDTLVYVPCG